MWGRQEAATPVPPLADLSIQSARLEVTRGPWRRPSSIAGSMLAYSRDGACAYRYLVFHANAMKSTTNAATAIQIHIAQSPDSPIPPTCLVVPPRWMQTPYETCASPPVQPARLKLALLGPQVAEATSLTPAGRESLSGGALPPLQEEVRSLRSGVTVPSRRPFGRRLNSPGLPLPLASAPCLSAQDGFL